MGVFIFVIAVVAFIIYIIIFIIFVQAAISTNKTRKLLEDIVESGAIPGVLEYRHKKEIKNQAKNILSQVGSLPKNTDDIIKALSKMDNDEEAANLITQINEKIKSQEVFKEPPKNNSIA